jgi:DNA-binding response OmpR family regulator
VDQPNAVDESNRHIAVIEDDLSLLAAYTEFFTNKGFTVYSFNGSMSQLQEGLLNITHLDFVISDYRLETETGDQIIQKIREEFNSHIPALILTADTSPQHIKLFKKLKIEVLYKPITTTEIYKFINEFFYTNSK